MNNPRCGLCGVSTGRHCARLLFPRGCGKAPPTRWTTSRAVFSLCPRLPASHPVSKSLACHDLCRSVSLPLRSPLHSDHAGPSLSLRTSSSFPPRTSAQAAPSAWAALPMLPLFHVTPRDHHAQRTPTSLHPPPSHIESLRACLSTRLSTPTQLHHASPTPGRAPGPAQISTVFVE